MEGEPEQPSTDPPRVSFTFQKKTGSQKVKPVVTAVIAKEQTDFVFSLEGKAVQSSKPLVAEKEYIVPFIGKNKWRLPPGSSKTDSSSTNTERRDERSEEEIALEKEAAKAVLKDFQEAQLRVGEAGDENLMVPLILQNKPPVVEGREDDELADIELRPEQSTLEEYDSMPIDKFGEAMLKGMGWKKGEAIGKTNKGLTEPIEFIPRVGGLGLGAAPRAPTEEKKKKRIKKPGEEERKVHGPYRDKDGRVRYYKNVGEDIPEPELEGFCVGNYARVCSGPHKDLVGKIVSVDDDTAHVVLKLTINSQLLRFSQHHLELVVKEDKHGRDGDRHDHHQSEKKEKKYGLIKKGQNRSPSPVNDRKHSKTSERPLEPTTKREAMPHLPSPKRTKYEHESREAELKRRLNDEPLRNSRSSDERHSSKKSRTKERDYHEEERYRSSGEGSSKHKQKSSSKHRVPGDGGKRGREEGEHYTKSKSSSSKSLRKIETMDSSERSWLSSNLRVRIIDQQFKKGRYYNTKVVIVDVVSLDSCICQTDDGKLLEGVSQSMLETVIPRNTGAHIMLVGGKRKRQLATIIQQDRSKAKATVETVQTKEVTTVHFDDICEYVGDVEDY